MVKSGKYTVKQPNIFGRIGTGIGKGLAESVPKEMDRGRLSAGLQQFEKNAENLSPFQQYTQLIPILSGSPNAAQALQALPELIKQQRARNAYGNKNPSNLQPSNISSQGNAPNNISQTQQQLQQGGLSNQGNQQMVMPEERGQPQIVETNPLRNEAVPNIPWTPDRRDEEIGRILDRRPDITVPEAMNIAADNEKRYLEQPKAYQDQDNYFRDQQNLADTAFKNHLETKLQKTGENVYKDITGENLVNLKRGMYKDLRTNPNATIEDVANTWSNKALDLAKSKSNLKDLSNRSFFDKLTKSGSTLDKLKTYQKSFAETGNQEEYYNILKSYFDLSPQGSASIAYPLSGKIESYVNQIKVPKVSEYNGTNNSRKYATDIENMLTRNDNLLSIARALSLKDPTFDQRAFFNQLREDQEQFPFSGLHGRNLEEAEADFLPTWGDILLLPILRGK